MDKKQLKKLSREEKINLYNELQFNLDYIGNINRSDFYNFEGVTDERIEKYIIDTNNQLRFEKTIIYGKRIIYFIVGGFILLGVIGLLLFGIKQLFL